MAINLELPRKLPAVLCHRVLVADLLLLELLQPTVDTAELSAHLVELLLHPTERALELCELLLRAPGGAVQLRQLLDQLVAQLLGGVGRRRGGTDGRRRGR